MTTPPTDIPDPDTPDPGTPATGGRDVGAAHVGAGILLSRLSGLVREVVTAGFLGLGVSADAFRAALRIPNLMQNLLGEGVLSASFIPVYSRLVDTDEEEAGRTAGAVAGLLAAATSVLCLLGMVLARPQCVRPQLGKDHHPRRAPVAPDAVSAALLDQRGLVDGVGVGLKDILADVEFGHENRMRAIVHDRIVGCAQNAGKQQPHRFLHDARIAAQSLRDAIPHELAQRPELIEQVFPLKKAAVRHILLHNPSSFRRGPGFAPRQDRAGQHSRRACTDIAPGE